MARDRLLTVAVIVLFGWQFWDRLQPASVERPLPPGSSASPTMVARGGMAQDELATVELFKRLSPSVVYISTSNIERDYFTLNVLQIPRGAGSGFVWSGEGHVVTNFHVIQGADEVEVVLSDQTRCPATVVGSEPDKDLAVLKIKDFKGRLQPIPVGTSADLQVGQKVFAIGNPFGLDQTLTTGVISGLGREIESLTQRPIQGVIQTDAAINPGNSGGPLLDSAGRLIGVNTSIISPTGAYAGIGFAVPVDTVARLVPQLIQFGRVEKPGLGISIAPDSILGRYQLEGVLILQVVPGGPADKAGLLPTRRDRRGRLFMGDRIVAINGKPVKSSHDFFLVLDGLEVNQKVILSIQRGDRHLEVPVSLEARPG